MQNISDLFRLFAIAVFFIFAASCVRAPIRSVDQAMRPTAAPQDLSDDLELSSLISGLESTASKLMENPANLLRFGPRLIRADAYANSLKGLIAAAREDASGAKFRQTLRERFEPFEIYGRSKWGEVFMTSYYEPFIEGARKPGGKFSRALYGIPKDMVEIDLGSFKDAPGVNLTNPSGVIVVSEQRSAGPLLRGRISDNPERQVRRITRYPDRAEIVKADAPKGQASVLAWVDPIDAFFLEIQGSGVVRFSDGSELGIGYAAQNGHPYSAIGKFLFDKIPKEKMSIQTIEAHLRALNANEAQELMNKNPSYVFFRELKNHGQAFMGTDLVTGRTIATDQTFFPKGGLAYLEFDRPVFAGKESAEPMAWQPTRRFVIDQDTGGAIRGPDRLDLYWGRGADAKQSAGVMKNKGRLMYFVPRPEFLTNGSGQGRVP